MRLIGLGAVLIVLVVGLVLRDLFVAWWRSVGPAPWLSREMVVDYLDGRAIWTIDTDFVDKGLTVDKGGVRAVEILSQDDSAQVRVVVESGGRPVTLDGAMRMHHFDGDISLGSDGAWIVQGGPNPPPGDPIRAGGRANPSPPTRGRPPGPPSS